MASDDFDDYQEIEERLYAQVHHDHSSHNEIIGRQIVEPRFQNTRPENTFRGRYFSTNIDESYQNQRSNQDNRRKQQSREQNQGRQGRNSQYNQRNNNNNRQQSSTNRSPDRMRNHPQQRNFKVRPYQSVLVGAGGELNRKQFEKRAQANNFPKRKGPIKGVNPYNATNSDQIRLENKIRVMQKMKKAMTRQQSGSSFKVPELPSTSRGTQGNQRKRAKKQTTTRVNSKVIFVDSCSDSESIPEERTTVKEEIQEENCDLNVSQDDDVIMIPTPAPEVVSLLDSDDDSDVQEMSSNNKAQKGPKEPGSRCVSPSTSSILSDDFIGQNDRTRLQSEFLFDLPQDEDLQGADKNQSTSSEDNSNESEDTSPIKDPRLMPIPSTVGNLSAFIVRGDAVESSFSDEIGHQSKKQKTDGRFADDEDPKDSDFMYIHELPVDDDSEDEEEDEEVREIEAQNDDDVIEMTTTTTTTNTTEEQPSTSRKRKISETPSDCDIMLNVSSKQQNTTNENQTVPIAATNDELVTIQIDDDNDDNNGELRKLDPEIGWNNEMKRYYHESWGGEQFHLRRILGGMCPDRKNWQIDVTDRFPPAPVKMRNRCRNCQEFSHKVQNCPLPKRRIVCHMCGENGHREPRCPNALCLTCGVPTRQFMRFCGKCKDNRDKRCALCGIRGHIFSLCPDKWRRYHNTIEDNVPLDETCVPNKASWCSVCAGSDHLAHNCLQAQRFMGAPLASSKIASYLPVYTIDPYKPKIVNTTDYSMMSFSKDFSFKWSSAVSENCNGFYNRFKEITGLMGQEMANDVDSELKKVRRKSQRRQRDNKAVNDVEVVEEVDLVVAGVDEELPNEETLNKSQESTESVNLNNFSFTREMSKIQEDQRAFQLHLEESDQRMESIEPVVFEDHRTEISEMAQRIGVTEEEILSVRAIKFPIESDDKEMDFIPLESNFCNDEPQPGPSTADTADVQVLMQLEEEKTDAKVFLTKEHSKFLLNEGESFLHEASQKYDLKLRVVWESIGNMLVMYGLPSKQNIFYNELLDFLRNVTLEEHIKNRNNAFSMPKVRDKLIKFIFEHLQRLKTDKKSLPHLKDLIRKMNQHQKNHQYKSADKLRRQLNTFLFGKIGLREGKNHLIGIIKKYQALKEEKPECETPEFREELRQHFMYLFTAYDHEKYDELLTDYEECVQKSRWPIPLKALFNIGNMIQMANGGNLDSNNDKNDGHLFFEDNVGERFQVVSAVGHTDGLEGDEEEPEKEIPESNTNETITNQDQSTQESQLNESEQSQQVQEKVLPLAQPTASPRKPQPQSPKTPEKPKQILTKDTPSKLKSTSYSEASRKIISEATSMFTLMNNQKAIAKLKLVEQKANQNQITEEDYQSLLHIQKIVQSKMANTPTTEKT